jgi:preprotein translocase subunit SecA
MNAQREVIYKRRFIWERLKLDIANMLYDTCELIIQDNKRANDFKTLNLTWFVTFYPSPVAEADF